MNIPTVTPVLNWRNKKNKKGLYPVHLRVYLNGASPKYYPVPAPQGIGLNQWSDKEDCWVKNTHPFAFEINNKISEKKNAIKELVKRHYSQNKPITFYAIDRELNRKGDKKLLNDYFRNYIDQPPETVTLDPVTWEKYEACLGHLNNFNRKIRLGHLDGTLIARFKNYLADLNGRDGKMAPATIKSYFDKLKVVLDHAAKKDHLLDSQEVEIWFEDIKISVPKKKEGQHWEIEEIQKLRKLSFTKKEYSLERDRDLFLFEVYTSCYYNDLQILKKSQLFKDIEYGYYIIGERDKNGNPTIIPLFKFPYAAEIIEKYRDHDENNEFLFRRDIFIEIQAFNRNLKILAKKAGVARKITNKTGRHTNAQMWIRFGAERPVLSKMMGHEKEMTTENYYKVNLLEVIEGTKSADFAKYDI